MGSVKTHKGTETVAERIRLIRRALNPHGTAEMSWPEFATVADVGIGTAKKWESRDGISHDSAVHLAERLSARGLACSPEWIRLGTPPIPAWAGGPIPSQHDSADVVSEPLRMARGDFIPSSVLAVLQRMPEKMQRAAIARAFARGLDHQELHGPGLLRAAMEICTTLERLGFGMVAKEIKSELMDSVFQELHKQNPPP